MLLPQHSKIMSYSERISTVRINIDNFGLGKMEVWGFPGDDSGKEPVCQYRKHEFDPWVGKILMSEGMATHYSVLAWKTPRTEKPGGLQSTDSRRVGHDRSNLAYTQSASLGKSI